MHLLTPRNLIGLVGLFIMAASASAQTPRLAFDFAGTDPARNLPWTQTSVRETTLTTEGWRYGSGISLVAASNDRLAFSVASDANLSTLAQAKANNAYLSVRIAPASGSVNLASNRINFTIRRESWHAPLQYAIFSSADNYASPLFATPLLDNADAATDSFTFLLPSTGFSSIGSTIEFRIYPFAARYAGHAASLTAFSLSTAAQTYTLSLSSTTGGTAQASPAGPLFESGQTVQLSAIPSSGYAFAGWQGGATGQSNPIALTVTSNLSITASFVVKPVVPMSLGGNLDSIVDWSTAWVFKDCFKMARTWLTRNADGSGAWDSAQRANLDANGWPLAVPFSPAAGVPPQILHTLLPLYDAGTYTVQFQGTGSIDLIPPGGARQTIDASGGTTIRTYNFSPTLADNMLYLEVRQSSGPDPVRNIQVVAPGQDTNLDTLPFHPSFLASLSPYRCLRFMDWLQTNFNPVTSWSQRTTKFSYTQARPEGAAHEYAIALANLSRKDAWICIPHAADDDYIRQTARLYRDTMDPTLKLYIEYSNETWNGIFGQTTYVQDRGQALGLDADRWQAGQKFTSRRSGDIFAIFEQEFGAANRSRLVHVLATQAAGAAGVTDVRIAAINNATVNPSGKRPDALAIAPYFGVNYTTADLSPMPTVDQIVTTVAQTEIARAASWTQAHKTLADQQGWRLVCYEGGQHFTGIWGAENNSTLVSTLLQANRDARMETRYNEYLAAMRSGGVDLFASFSHIGEWSKWGSWGILEYQQQPAASAPKWRAIKAWADATTTPTPTPNPTPTPTPTPTLVPVVTAPSSIKTYRLRLASFTVSVSNRPAILRATGLPSGMILNATTGVVSGKPRKRGTYRATFRAQNSGGTAAAVTTIYVR